jgi:hypothetical protein
MRIPINHMKILSQILGLFADATTSLMRRGTLTNDSATYATSLFDALHKEAISPNYEPAVVDINLGKMFQWATAAAADLIGENYATERETLLAVREEIRKHIELRPISTTLLFGYLASIRTHLDSPTTDPVEISRRWPPRAEA